MVAPETTTVKRAARMIEARTLTVIDERTGEGLLELG